jgi:hypothetical protein
MAIIDFPIQQGVVGKRLDDIDFTMGGVQPGSKALEDWPWDKDLGKPYGDINGQRVEAISIANPPEDEVNDLARYKEDKVTSPAHYKHLGVECIQITENMNFCLGNVVKYCYRCNLKGGVEDLKKALWYLNREIARREKT